MLESPGLFLRDVDPVGGRAVFTPMDEASYRASAFLDNRIVRAGDRDLVSDLDDLIDLARTAGAGRRLIHYLFHVGHCGSTLISRVLGERSCYLALREPPLLMGLSRSLRGLDRPGFPFSRRRWEELKDLSLLMLAKSWHSDQVPLVKPTSHAGNLIPTLMKHTGRERAVCLYVDLESYLATMLRPHTRRETRLFARDFRVREFSALVPEASGVSDDFSDVELAAMSWLLHARDLAEALDDPEIGGRCLTVHFDDFLGDPADMTARICKFLGSPLSASEWDRIAAEGWLSRSAKTPGEAYGLEDRRRELASVRSKHREEIDQGMSWAAAACRSAPFSGLPSRFGPARARPGNP